MKKNITATDSELSEQQKIKKNSRYSLKMWWKHVIVVLPSVAVIVSTITNGWQFNPICQTWQKSVLLICSSLCMDSSKWNKKVIGSRGFLLSLTEQKGRGIYLRDTVYTITSFHIWHLWQPEPVQFILFSVQVFWQWYQNSSNLKIDVMAMSSLATKYLQKTMWTEKSKSKFQVIIIRKKWHLLFIQTKSF